MSLDLDERQRAMLEEMHVRVWWPPAHAPAIQAATRAEPAANLVARPVAVPPAVAPQAETRKAATAAPAIAAAVGPALYQPTGSVPAPPASGIDQMDWPALAATVAGCTACKLCVGRKAPVFVEEPGNRQADWLVVGEPPDEYEERAGTPFTGQAGQLLDNMLRAVKLTRDGSGSTGARLASVVKCRTTPVRNPRMDELATCAAYLKREIALVQPKVILAVGRFAALSLLSEASPELAGLPFGKLRGQLHHYQGVPVVVTHHPARLLRAQEDKAGAWADLCLAQGAARRAPPTLQPLP